MLSMAQNVMLERSLSLKNCCTACTCAQVPDHQHLLGVNPRTDYPCQQLCLFCKHLRHSHTWKDERQMTHLKRWLSPRGLDHGLRLAATSVSEVVTIPPTPQGHRLHQYRPGPDSQNVMQRSGLDHLNRWRGHLYSPPAAYCRI